MDCEVTIKISETYLVPVSAENKDEAIEKAYDILETESTGAIKYRYHYDSDSEAGVEEV